MSASSLPSSCLMPAIVIVNYYRRSFDNFVASSEIWIRHHESFRAKWKAFACEQEEQERNLGAVEMIETMSRKVKYPLFLIM